MIASCERSSRRGIFQFLIRSVSQSRVSFCLPRVARLSSHTLKIALVILHADPARGGAERYTVDLAAALAKRGHEVSLLASSHAAELPHPNVRAVTIASWGMGRNMKYGCFLQALNAELKQTRYDVVHSMLPVDRCDVYHPHAGMAAAAAQKWNAWLNPRRGAMARVERKLLTGVNPPITIALSEYVKRSIREHYLMPDERLVTLFNAVDLERFQPSEPPRRDTVEALFVGHDFERKGLTAALLAIDRLKDNRLRLTIVGNDRRRAQLVSLTVRQVPGMSDIRPFYRDADFFVLPTKHDPCSLVVLEALAMGLPVISTVFNGATEIMTDGVHGFVLKDPGDVEALADAIRKMLDSGTRAKMREACLALRPQLSYEHHLDQLMAFYTQVKT